MKVFLNNVTDGIKQILDMLMGVIVFFKEKDYMTAIVALLFLPLIIVLLFIVLTVYLFLFLITFPFIYPDYINSKYYKKYKIKYYFGITSSIDYLCYNYVVKNKIKIKFEEYNKKIYMVKNNIAYIFEIFDDVYYKDEKWWIYFEYIEEDIELSSYLNEMSEKIKMPVKIFLLSKHPETASRYSNCEDIRVCKTLNDLKKL